MFRRKPRGNTIQTRWTDPQPPTVRKVPANSVPYGESISINGKYVWAAYAGDELIAVAATSSEARAKYRAVLRARESEAAEAKRKQRHLTK